MPIAPHLATPQLENPLVDSRVSVIPPALTIPPGWSSSSAKEEHAQAVIFAEPAPVELSIEPVEEEINIETFEGIGHVCGDLLRNLGISTVSDLLRVGATERGRRLIADETGVTPKVVIRWVYREDLLRVKGIGRKYSTLLEKAGVNTAKDLSTENTRHLCQTLRTVNKDRKLVVRTPPSKTIKVWVRNAKKLEPILVE